MKSSKVQHEIWNLTILLYAVTMYSDWFHKNLIKENWPFFHFQILIFQRHSFSNSLSHSKKKRLCNKLREDITGRVFWLFLFLFFPVNPTFENVVKADHLNLIRSIKFVLITLCCTWHDTRTVYLLYVTFFLKCVNLP